jgi:hypothetical protein
MGMHKQPFENSSMAHQGGTEQGVNRGGGAIGNNTNSVGAMADG